MCDILKSLAHTYTHVLSLIRPLHWCSSKFYNYVPHLTGIMKSLHICLEAQKSDGTTSLIPNNISSTRRITLCSSPDRIYCVHRQPSHSFHTSTDGQTGCHRNVNVYASDARPFLSKRTPQNQVNIYWI